MKLFCHFSPNKWFRKPCEKENIIISSLFLAKFTFSFYICKVFIPNSCLWVGLFEDGDLYIEKALLDALCLTFWNLAVP